MTIQADETIKGADHDQQDTTEIIYTNDGRSVPIPIEITDSFRFTKRSMYDDKPLEPSLLSKLINVFVRKQRS